MKLFAVLLSISAVALASLEPAGYRPPGSAAALSQQYLPPHQQSQHDHHQQQQHHQQPPSSPLPPSSNYLPPNYNRPTSDVPVQPPPSQYLPPQQHQQPQPPAPSGNYLPATEKPYQPRPLPPASDYLPPQVPSSRPPPANDYLPPLSRSQPTIKSPASDYLPPKRPVAALPANDYLPPHHASGRQRPIPSPALKTAPASKTDYLPPSRSNAVPSAPKNDYLPPSQYSAPPAARISVVTASPYKLDGPAYTKQQQLPQQQQAKFGGPGLVTAASSSSARSGGYSSGAASEGYQRNAYQQPADNYLPPHAGASDVRSAADQGGYQYGAAAAAAGAGGFGLARSEQPTEPAKYDFEYRVSDEFGNDFGHKETREGAQTHGSYSVLLPDGRKQIVQYEADENGFKPRISYEDAATVLGPKAALAGYDGNANNLGY